MSFLRRYLSYVLLVAGLVVGLGLGLAIGADEDDGRELGSLAAEPDEDTQSSTAEGGAALAPACREALDIAIRGMGAAVQAASLAQSAANAPSGQPGAPSQESINELATQVQAMRQQVTTARAACEATSQRPANMGSSTTVSTTTP